MFCEFPKVGRCCFCLPLRRGVLTFGYLNILFDVFMLVVYSISIHDLPFHELVYHGSVTQVAAEICLALYCLEILFNVVLLYGAHRKHLLSLKIYYYYTVTTIVATVMIEILDCVYLRNVVRAVEVAALTFAGLVLQIYLLILVRSLLNKVERNGPHLYENQLHQIVNGEVKIEGNGVYDQSTVIPNEDV